MIKIGTDCSGIEAPIQAFKRLGIPYHHSFSCDVDKFVRIVSDKIYKPDIFFPDLMARDNSTAPHVDLYVAGFPCQAFSMAGKRKGFDDVRGSVFFGVADYIKQTQPPVFILENVKGLLSHDKGRTFQTITDLLSNCGGTVNGQIAMDFFDDGLGYHIHHQVLNTKNHGIPQNRERIFIVGFKNQREFSFPKPELLIKRLKDVMERDVDEKYYVGDDMLKKIKGWKSNQNPLDYIFEEDDVMTCVLARGDGEIHAGMKLIKTHSLFPRSSKTGKGGTGHLSKDDGTAYCLDTGNTNAVELKQISLIENDSYHDFSRRVYSKDGLGRTLMGQGGNCNDKAGLYKIGNKIRRLTPLECFRLQDFPDSFHQECVDIGISDTQRYKMAGNSMTVRVMEKILRKIYL